jgi:6-phosphogluconolactonase
MIQKMIFPTAEAVVDSLAQELKAYSEQGRAVHISLSGGSTPKKLFKLLASPPYASSIAWHHLHFWWGDERCVAPEHAESNYGEAHALLFSQVAIAPENIHRIRGEAAPQAEAVRFANEMRDTLPLADGVPVFDWILLGMGADGHTASLFPGQTDYQDPHLSVVARHPESGQSRISKTARVLQAAKRISYLVLGQEKAEMVHTIFTQPAATLPYPAARIHALHGETQWYLDLAAAAKIVVV